MAVDKDEPRASSNVNDANEESEAESEYEIEAIVAAKRGMFPHGRIGYLVKWKGYGEEDNSWVDEADAGNADELIKEFWEKKKSRKTETKGKRGRKSTAQLDEESDAGSASVSVSTKKRGRKPQARVGSDEIEEVDARSQKKPRTGTPSSTAEKDVTTEDSSIIIGDMSKYDSWPNWEDLVEQIDTVEKEASSGNIMVYFTLKSGERIRETTEVIKARCPQKLISFYEAHLKWKEAEVEDTYV